MGRKVGDRFTIEFNHKMNSPFSVTYFLNFAEKNQDDFKITSQDKYFDLVFFLHSERVFFLSVTFHLCTE